VFARSIAWSSSAVFITDSISFGCRDLGLIGASAYASLIDEVEPLRNSESIVYRYDVIARHLELIPDNKKMMTECTRFCHFPQKTSSIFDGLCRNCKICNGCSFCGMIHNCKPFRIGDQSCNTELVKFNAVARS
jgi:hypothetical protein